MGSATTKKTKFILPKIRRESSSEFMVGTELTVFMRAERCEEVLITNRRKPKVPLAGVTKVTENQITDTLADAIIQATECTGFDGKGNGGLVGYLNLWMMVTRQPRKVVGLLEQFVARGKRRTLTRTPPGLPRSVGSDGKGKGALVEYLTVMATKHPREFARLWRPLLAYESGKPKT